MNIVVVLRGPAGVGKSTVAGIVQARMGVNWTVLDVDHFKKYMPLKDGQTNRAERSKIAHDVSKYFALQMYQKSYDIIMEEMYKKPYHDSLVEFLSQHDMRYIKIFLAAPVEEAVARSAAREKNPPEDEIRHHHAEIEPYEDDFVIDTTKHSAREAADLIIERIQIGSVE